LKDFETSLLTLLGVSLVLWRRKADNALSNPCFIGRKKCREGSRHKQYYI
jgi:hypothetical protein